MQEPWFTWANLATAIRVVAGVVVFAIAAANRDETWNYAGLAVYWVLDVVDGFLARALDQETRLGAQMDILADRLLVAFFYLNYVAIHPEMIVPVALFLFQFMGIDHYLSNQFMRWPIKSPNYFYEVDRRNLGVELVGGRQAPQQRGRHGGDRPDPVAGGELRGVPGDHRPQGLDGGPLRALVAPETTWPPPREACRAAWPRRRPASPPPTSCRRRSAGAAPSSGILVGFGSCPSSPAPRGSLCRRRGPRSPARRRGERDADDDVLLATRTRGSIARPGPTPRCRGERG